MVALVIVLALVVIAPLMWAVGFQRQEIRKLNVQFMRDNYASPGTYDEDPLLLAFEPLELSALVEEQRRKCRQTGHQWFQPSGYAPYCSRCGDQL